MLHFMNELHVCMHEYLFVHYNDWYMLLTKLIKQKLVLEYFLVKTDDDS